MGAAFVEDLNAGFATTAEVVPPAGPDPEPLLAKLAPVAGLPVWGFSVAAGDPVAEGLENAREVIGLARQGFAGACLMPPFDHFESLEVVL